MWDFFTEALKTARDNGLGFGAVVSIIVLGALAWFAGSGFKLALQNVKSLLDQSEMLRKTIASQLDNANARLEEQAQEFDMLRRALNDAESKSSRLVHDLARLKSEYASLEAETHVLRAEVQQYRIRLNAPAGAQA